MKWLCCRCLVAQSQPTLCDPMDCNQLGPSAHGISQARLLEWVAISFSKGSSWPRDWTCIYCLGRQILCHWATREVKKAIILLLAKSLLKLMCIKLVMPSNHFIICRPLLLLPSIFPSIRVFSNELTLPNRWPKYWSFSISASHEY